ncbi:MAG: hypothetical protein PHG05_03370 [Candidatus Nanoarchaeia archaeon]|nr:hypothetical protein [Candidatus Nanoarchaeia archaeon]
MNDQIRKDIIKIIDEALSAIDKKDISAIKESSNHTIHDATTNQDDNSAGIAVIIYSIYKIFNNPELTKHKRWPRFLKDLRLYLNKAKQALERNDFKKYNKFTSMIIRSMSRIDSKLGTYIASVIENAKIKKGSKIYEHGVSASRAAEILGITPWELMNYIGSVNISDEQPIITKKTKERLEYTRSLFKI